MSVRDLTNRFAPAFRSRSGVWWSAAMVRWFLTLCERTMTVGLTLHYIERGDLSAVALLASSVGLCRLTRLPLSVISDCSMQPVPTWAVKIAVTTLLGLSAAVLLTAKVNSLWLWAAVCLIGYNIMNPVLSRLAFLCIAEDRNAVLPANALYRGVRAAVLTAIPVLAAGLLSTLGATCFLMIGVTGVLAGIGVLMVLRSTSHEFRITPVDSFISVVLRAWRIVRGSELRLVSASAVAAGFFSSAGELLLACLFAVCWTTRSYPVFLTAVMVGGLCLPIFSRIPRFATVCSGSYALSGCMSAVILIAVITVGPVLPLALLYGFVSSYCRVSLGVTVKTSVPPEIAATTEGITDTLRAIGFSVAPILLSSYFSHSVTDLPCDVSPALTVMTIQLFFFSTLAVLLFAKSGSSSFHSAKSG